MSFLDSDLLARIHERAADADATNTYPEKDLEELREAGYLSAFVPTEFGGAGLSLTEITAEQTALAKAAPGTALGINMHQIIVGLGRYLVAHGNARGEQVLRDAVAGEVFGFGISEPGNDLVLFGSTTRATATADGGYSFEGTKIFTSLSPVWTRLLIFGQSLGGTNAIAAVGAGNQAGIRAVAIESTFSSYSDIANDKFSGSGLLVRNTYSSRRFIGRISPIPLLLIHGTADQVIPDKHSQTLFDLAGEPKQLVLIPNGTHLGLQGKSGYEQLLLNFFNRHSE